MSSGEVLPSIVGEFENGDRPFTARYVVLRSTSIRPEDAGEYRCVVNNIAGQQTEEIITVNVQGNTACV